MTGASKLFHSKRIRFGNRDNAIDERESDSSIAEGNSSRYITTHRRRHHLTGHNNRRNLDGCNSPPRRIHRHRISDLVQLEPSGTQSPSVSIINSEDFRNIRRWGATENDRLPGVVLLARERLLERLRGVHVSETSRSSISSSFHQDEISYNGYSSFIEMNSTNMVEEPVTESWQPLMAPGLSQDALNGLSIKVYNNVEENNGGPNASRECSICLEVFENGDELINLACMHSFHSCCLFPWVEVCGACPNCRTAVVIASNKLVS